MTKHGAIELDWADGTYSFRLGMGEVQELEEKAGVGIFLIGDQLSPAVRAARANVITETIRLGLIGGGMAPVQALRLVRRYAEEMPLADHLLVAFAIVMAAVTKVNGTELPKDPPSGEAGAAKTVEPTSPLSTPPPP